MPTRPAWTRPGTSSSPTTGRAARSTAASARAPRRPARRPLRPEAAGRSSPSRRPGAGRRSRQPAPAPARASSPKTEATVVARAADRADQQKPAAPAPKPATPGTRHGREAVAAARCGRRRRQEHERLAHRAHGDERARGAGQAAGRQPHRHQQPPQARARGGKISFTHLIGYALVRALDDFPNMNSAFAEVDGKPVPRPARARELRPGHRPAQARRLAVAGGRLDQGRRGDGLRPVLGRLRGHHPPGPRQQADDGGLLRHHDQPHQPGHDRHQPLGAAADRRARAPSSASAPWSTPPSSRG